MKKQIFLILLISNSIGPLFAKEQKKPETKSAQKMSISLSTKGNDIAFDVSSLQVPFGQDLVLSFENEAKKTSEIAHNIAILKPGSTEEVLKYFQDNDYDAEKIKTHKSVLAITPWLSPGESAELKLTKEMLSTPGFYPYVCLVPGHADMLGMKGLMHVKKAK